MEKPANKANPVAVALDRCRSAFVSTGLLSCAINLLMLTGPLFMLQIYDRVLASRSVPTLLALGVLVVVLYCFFGFFDAIRSRIHVRLGRMVDERLRAMSFDRALALPSRGQPAVGSQPISDLAAIRQFISGPGPGAFFDLPWSPLFLVVIALLHPVLGLLALAAAIILGVLAIYNDLTTRRPLNEAAGSMRAAVAAAEENRRNAEAIHVMGMAGPVRERWLSQHSESLLQHMHGMDRSAINVSTSRTLRLMFQSAVLGLGAYLAVRQEISPGAMIAASIIMARALAPIEVCVTQWPNFLSFRSALRRLKDALADSARRRRPVSLPQPQGQLSVDRLYAYTDSPGAEPILKNISFELPAGSVLGIIGPSGAGKSTLVRAIANVWPATAGDVRLDGATFDQWDPAVLGRHIGYVPQEVSLMDGTVAENISRFYPDADDDAIIEAAQLADVHRLVTGLPDGYQTRIGRDGMVLSAGQRQRIALARALYGDPQLVLMDEPNSNLDPEGEIALRNAIEHLKERGATVIVVAHRPNAVASADLFLVLMNGSIARFGNREEVLKGLIRPVQAVAGGAG